MTSDNSQTAELHGLRILLVEDQYLIAQYMVLMLEDLGARIIGPCATVRQAIARIEEDQIDCAIMDVNVRGGKVFPAADLLDARKVPYLFVTGYDVSEVPVRFRSHPVCVKPVDMPYLVRLLRTEMSL